MGGLLPPTRFDKINKEDPILKKSKLRCLTKKEKCFKLNDKENFTVDDVTVLDEDGRNSLCRTNAPYKPCRPPEENSTQKKLQAKNVMNGGTKQNSGSCRGKIALKSTSTSIKKKKSARKLNISTSTVNNMQYEFQAKKLFFEKFQGGKKVADKINSKNAMYPDSNPLCTGLQQTGPNCTQPIGSAVTSRDSQTYRFDAQDKSLGNVLI